MRFADLDDDTLYKIKLLPLWVRGDFLKELQTIWWIRDLIKRREQELDDEHRCYPDPYNVQVFQFKYTPPTFIITSRFEPLQQLVRELGMPSDQDDTYYSTIVPGDFYFERLSGTSYTLERPVIDRLKRYSVELFGLRIKWPDGITVLDMPDPPMPDPSQYSVPPRYIRDSLLHLVQIYRLRIFNCPTEVIHTTTSTPLSPRRPTCLFFEECWHPRALKEQDMRGLETLPHFRFTEVTTFWADCRRLMEKGKKLGRPLGSGEYQDATQFTQDVTDAYRKCVERLGRKPSQAHVADELLMSRSRLSEKLAEFGIPWPPC
jgi:hypothetical protein